jgi:hypothetical protein
MATLTKQRDAVNNAITPNRIEQAKAKAVAACAAAYSAQPVPQPDGTTFALCWSGRIARGYDKLAIARIAKDGATVKALESGIQALQAKATAAQKAAEDAASAWAALAAATGVTVQPTDVYPPTCTCEGCQAQKNYQDKVQWRAVYVTCLYDFIAPTSADTPPIIDLLRRLRNNKGDKDASDRLWAHLRRISDAGEAYARACSDAAVRPNWRALWPDGDAGE